jgi:hypothetical protein
MLLRSVILCGILWFLKGFIMKKSLISMTYTILTLASFAAQSQTLPPLKAGQRINCSEIQMEITLTEDTSTEQSQSIQVRLGDSNSEAQNFTPVMMIKNNTGQFKIEDCPGDHQCWSSQVKLHLNTIQKGRLQVSLRDTFNGHVTNSKTVCKIL